MNINDVSLELSKSFIQDPLIKMMTPKMIYRFRAWMKLIHGKQPQATKEQIKKALIKKMIEVAESKELKKNQVMASVYDSGVVKLDFGSDIPDNIKKAAMRWAKDKGLKATEASLNKSKNSNSSVTYTKTQGTILNESKCKRVRWTF